MDAPANVEPHFKWLALLTRLTILTEQKQIKTISFIQHLKHIALNDTTATQEKILQDSFTTKHENRTVTAPYSIPCCIVKLNIVLLESTEVVPIYISKKSGCNHLVINSSSSIFWRTCLFCILSTLKTVQFWNMDLLARGDSFFCWWQH